MILYTKRYYKTQFFVDSKFIIKKRNYFTTFLTVVAPPEPSSIYLSLFQVKSLGTAYLKTLSGSYFRFSATSAS